MLGATNDFLRGYGIVMSTKVLEALGVSVYKYYSGNIRKYP
jgi:hypothetical protein